jgi:hypothetical protein
LSGPAVGPGRLAARDLAELVRLLDQAVLRVGKVLSRALGRAVPQRPRELRAACRLYLVSWAEGSAVAGFDVAEPPAGTASLAPIGAQSLRHFVAGLAQIASDRPGEIPLPDGFDEGVLETSAALGKLLDHGIATMIFTEPSLRQSPSVCYDLSLRERIRALAGRVRAETDRSDIDPSRHRPAFPARHDFGATLLPADESAFWRSASLDQLAADQGVLPITDIGELDAVWSEGDEVFDDALSEVLEERVQRRRREGRAR